MYPLGLFSSLPPLWGQRLRSFPSGMSFLFVASPIGLRFSCCGERSLLLFHAFVVHPGAEAIRREKLRRLHRSVMASQGPVQEWVGPRSSKGHVPSPLYAVPGLRNCHETICHVSLVASTVPIGGGFAPVTMRSGMSDVSGILICWDVTSAYDTSYGAMSGRDAWAFACVSSRAHSRTVTTRSHEISSKLLFSLRTTNVSEFGSITSYTPDKTGNSLCCFRSSLPPSNVVASGRSTPAKK